MSKFEIVLVKKYVTNFDHLCLIIKFNKSSFIDNKISDQSHFDLPSDHDLRLCPEFVPNFYCKGGHRKVPFNKIISGAWLTKILFTKLKYLKRFKSYP